MPGYSTLSSDEIRREIQAIRRFGSKLRRSPDKGRGFLIRAGFLTKDGKRLASRYR